MRALTPHPMAAGDDGKEGPGPLTNPPPSITPVRRPGPACTTAMDSAAGKDLGKIVGVFYQAEDGEQSDASSLCSPPPSPCSMPCKDHLSHLFLVSLCCLV